MKFVSNSIGNDKELAKVINGFIKKYIKVGFLSAILFVTLFRKRKHQNGLEENLSSVWQWPVIISK